MRSSCSPDSIVADTATIQGTPPLHLGTMHGRVRYTQYTAALAAGSKTTILGWQPGINTRL